MNKNLHEIKVGEIFKIDDEEYELISHDDSGSMSAGPGCRRIRDNEIVYFSYIAWESNGQTTCKTVEFLDKIY